MASINSHCSSNGAHQQHQLDNNAEQTNRVQDAFDNNKLVSAPTDDAQSMATISKVECSTDEPLSFGLSHWDKLPRELHEMILEASSPLTRYVNGFLTVYEKKTGWRVGARSIWLEAFDVDWQGDLSTLPGSTEIDKFLTNDDLCHVKSRSMYYRLYDLYPEYTVSNQKWIDFDRCIKQIQNNLCSTDMNQTPFQYQPRLRLIHIPMRNMWLDLIVHPVQKYLLSLSNVCIPFNHVNRPQHPATQHRPDFSRFSRFGFDIQGHGSSVYHISPSIEFVAVYGHYDLFIEMSKSMQHKFSADVTRRIAANAHLRITQWLHEHDMGVFSAKVMDRAAKNGHLEVVKFLHEHRNEGCTDDAMDWAASRGLLGVVKFLHANRSEGCTRYAMDWAAKNGHFNVVRFLHENRTEGCMKKAMDEAAKYGHLEIVQYLHENRNEGCTEDAMNWAAKNGHLHVVKFLHYNRSEGCTYRAMHCAAVSGHLDVVKFLHENRSEGCTSLTMYEAAGQGRLDVVKWLFEHRSDGRTADAMHNAAVNGHLHVLKWLHENGTEVCLMRTINKCVKRGHLDIVRFLHEVQPELCTRNVMLLLMNRGHVDFVLSMHDIDSQCTISMIECASSYGRIDIVRRYLGSQSDVSLYAIKNARSNDIARLLVSYLGAEQKKKFKDELKRTGHVQNPGYKALRFKKERIYIQPRQMLEQHGCVPCTIL